MLVPIAANGGIVSIRFDIRTRIEWRYTYRSEEYNFTRGAAEPPADHTLGTPLEVNANIDSWDIKLINAGDSEEPYVVSLTWLQDGRQIQKWTAPESPPGSLQPGKIVIEDGVAYLRVTA